MSDPRAILATFTDFDLVQTRKVAKLVFEVPIENFKAALDALGMPEPGGGTWCGIARVNIPGAGASTAARERVGDEDRVVAGATSPTRTNLPTANPHIKRAMALANDTGFWNFLRRTNGTVVKDTNEALGAIKELCGFESRSELVEGSAAAARLRALASASNAWQRGT